MSETRRTTKAGLAGWCLYDFANSGFTTLVVTFVYATWFSKAMAPDEIKGTYYWSLGITLSAILMALSAPFFGARADRLGKRLASFRLFSLLTIGGTVALAFIAPPHWVPALFVFALTNVCYELALTFYNAFLPSIVSKRRAGLTSGIAWGLGYVGGLLCLAIGFLFTGLPGMLEPLLDTAEGWNIRATNLLVAGWFLLFALPALFALREPAPPDPRVGSGLGRISEALERVRRYPQAMKLLIARLVYNDGIVTIFAFGGIYAAGTFGMSLADIIVFGIVLNLAAGVGAFVFSVFDHYLGGKWVVLVTLVGLTAAAALAALAPNRTWFWVAGIVIGLLVGPNQSASRSLMARFVPKTRSGELFGLYAFSGKLTSFAGPLLLGQLTHWFGSQRIGVASVLLFFVGGGVLLLLVDEKAGCARADEEDALLASASGEGG